MSSFTDPITAQIEVRIIQHNAIIKVMRSRKFRAIVHENQPAFSQRLEVYEDRQIELQSEIDRLMDDAGGKAEIWRGILDK